LALEAPEVLIVAAQQSRAELTVRACQLDFKEHTNRVRPDHQTHNAQPGNDGVQHCFTPCSSAMNGEIEFIDDPMKKKVGE
jgi:hypothetical protein